MPGIPFVKMSGAGNDFIIVDNRAGLLRDLDLSEFARRICDRRMSLGGDQLMLIEPPTSGGDFSMRTINVDGAEVEMCGNASRCVARYAHSCGLAGSRMTIETRGGPVHARIEGNQVRVRLQLSSPILLDRDLTADGEPRRIHTVRVSGTPHAVTYLPDVAGASAESIRRLGAAIRHHADFPHGVNVNFVQVVDRHTLRQRTYERGVEGETPACGTGAVASTVVSALRGEVDSPVRVAVPGGELSVAYERGPDGFRELELGGGAWFVAEGTLHPEAWSWAAPGPTPRAAP
ncbi:MAG: diaminopimelate epimerase [Candidatus Methylomirabilota bacterium]